MLCDIAQGVNAATFIQLVCQGVKVILCECTFEFACAEVPIPLHITYVPTFGEAGVELNSAGSTFLRGDHDNTVGTAGTVDGRGRRIFQDGDVSDVVGIDIKKRIGIRCGTKTADAQIHGGAGVAAIQDDAVNNIDGVTCAADRAVATDLDRGGNTGLAAVVDDLETGYFVL